MKKYFVTIALAVIAIMTMTGCAAKNVKAAAAPPAQQEVEQDRSVAVTPQTVNLKGLTPAVFHDYSKEGAEQTKIFTISGYPLGSYAIDAGQPQETLASALAELRKIKDAGAKDMRIKAVGSASYQGTEEYNMVLGQKRADTVAKKVGEAFSDVKITTVSLGEKMNVRQVEIVCAFNSEKNFNFAMTYGESLKLLGIDAEHKYALVAVSLSEEEMKMTGWRICSSYAVYNDGKMSIRPENDYRRRTEVMNDGRLLGYLPLEKNDQGNQYYWPRIWVSNDDNPNLWGIINMASVNCRLDDQGNPGYELLFSSNGEWGPVPDSWPTRD